VEQATNTTSGSIKLALELQDSGVQIDAGQVAWILATGQFQIRRRVEREGK
jgi:hypothetical protein